MRTTLALMPTAMNMHQAGEWTLEVRTRELGARRIGVTAVAHTGGGIVVVRCRVA